MISKRTYSRHRIFHQSHNFLYTWEDKHRRGYNQNRSCRCQKQVVLIAFKMLSFVEYKTNIFWQSKYFLWKLRNTNHSTLPWLGYRSNIETCSSGDWIVPYRFMNTLNTLLSICGKRPCRKLEVKVTWLVILPRVDRFRSSYTNALL